MYEGHIALRQDAIITLQLYFPECNQIFFVEWTATIVFILTAGLHGWPFQPCLPESTMYVQPATWLRPLSPQYHAVHAIRSF